ncbi:hypothetical protein TSUD_52260 [Trifolium subterraneum]|uniref:Reverse transcriptase zinc-binding domain-containing protein n=1 Tax=Trifolium subterraneum TaxID=3900 RepID=A0A2Z6N3X1_TRISU|nr:hypothetical protein TSUD_52260 [Trifolium subterraneum]
MCGNDVECSRHLFIHCDFAAHIWYAICRWLGVVVILPPEVMMMNDKIFNEVAGVVDDAVDMIQRLSWQWFVRCVIFAATGLAELGNLLSAILGLVSAQGRGGLLGPWFANSGCCSLFLFVS